MVEISDSPGYIPLFLGHQPESKAERAFLAFFCYNCRYYCVEKGIGNAG